MHLRVSILAAIGAVVAIAGCGGSDSNDNPTTLSLKISENGKAAAFQAPKTAKGGLVKVELANQGKAPHGVQFIQYASGHSQQEVLQLLGQNSNVIPPWVKLEGGIGSVARARPERPRSTCRAAITSWSMRRHSVARVRAAVRRRPRA